MSNRQTVATTIVFDYEYDAMGNPLVNARVEVRLVPSPQPINQAPLLSLNTQVESVLTDANGYWQLALAPNSGITPANTYYSVKVAGRTPYLMNVPAGGGPVQAISNLVNQPSALAANTTNLVGPLSIATLVHNQVVFAGTGGLLTGDPLLWFDDTNKRLGIGTSAPAQPLHVVGNVRFGGASDFSWDNTNKRLSLDGGLTSLLLNAIDLAVNTHHMRYEPVTSNSGVNIVVTGSGAVGIWAAGRGHQMATGVTNPSSASQRIGLVASAAGNMTQINKVRRIEFQGYIADTLASARSYYFVTVENVDVAPSVTAHHFGIKNINGVVSFSTADGATEQTTDISAFVGNAANISYVITFDGTTARCYLNGTLRATHATNVPTSATAPTVRLFIDNNNSANARIMAFYAVEIAVASS